MRAQSAILFPVPACARFVVLGLRPGASASTVLERLTAMPVDETLIVGLGEPLVRAAGARVPGLRAFPALSGPGATPPATQGAIWMTVGGADPGDALHRALRAVDALGVGLVVDEDVLAFRFGEGRDLSGYEDGTENPKGDLAIEAAIVDPGGTAPISGSSFVAVQRWAHDLASLGKLSHADRDALVGRHHETNEELPDAPPSAHVKRAAQESFVPPAFMLRRSMPWGTVGAHGLFFVAFGASFDPFERVLTRMIGTDDGIVDGLFRFARPLSGGYYWCPPVVGGKLDLAAMVGG